MVHYIRFLRTPQVNETKKKTLDVSAVLCVTTDLGDAFYAQTLELTIQLIDANKSHEVLQTQNITWQDGLRALKTNMSCLAKHASRLVRVHVACVKSSSAVVPNVVGIWSNSFTLTDKQRSEPLVERRFDLFNGSTVRSVEETGDSIARHIWDASLGFLIFLQELLTPGCHLEMSSIADVLANSKSRRLQIIELGAGCGIVGITFAQLVKCDVLLTDLEEAQEILQLNMSTATLRPGSTIQKQVLHWGTNIDDRSYTKFDLVLMSDCIYDPDSSVKLVDTLQQLAKHAPEVLFLVGFKRRHEGDMVFFNSMKKNDFKLLQQCTIALPHNMTDYDVDVPSVEFYAYGGPAIRK